MKKLLVLVALFTTVYATQAVAQGQGGGDPAARAARMKEMLKPVVEKLKLTDAQVDKVIEINMKSRSEMRGLRDLSDADRQKKRDEIVAAQNKAYKEIPLTDDQVKGLNDFFEEQRKQMQQQRQNGGGGGNGN